MASKYAPFLFFVPRLELTFPSCRAQDLAVDSIEELWFGASTSSAKKSTNDVGQLAQVILKTTGVFRDRPPPVDEVLRHVRFLLSFSSRNIRTDSARFAQIMAKHLEKGTPAPLDRVKEVMEALIDGLVEDDYGMVRHPLAPLFPVVLTLLPRRTSSLL